MSLILKACIEHEDNRNECVAYENSKTFKLINQSRFVVRKVKVDKCLPQVEGEKRCDFLFSINCPEMKRVFFIELKGDRLVDAVKQIHETINYLKENFKDHVLEARIVGSGDVPNLRTNPYYLRLQRAINPTKGTIKRATNKFYSETI